MRQRNASYRVVVSPSTGSPSGPTWICVSSTATRSRTGGRSRGQLAALDWSGDPAPVLDHLVVFGPARADIIE